jgi:hypothetical protein
VYHEASPLLYSRNRFEFTDLGSTRRLSAALTSFFSQTGDKNAGFIRHLCIDFPTFSDYELTLKDDSIKTLELIREKSPSSKRRYVTFGNLNVITPGIH